MNKDTVVGILGAVILVAAMVGIFYYEGTQAPSGVATGPTTPGAPPGGSANLTVSDGPRLASDGSQPAGATVTKNVTINQTGVRRVEFTLTWTDDASQPPGGPDTLKLTVTPPSGAGAGAKSDERNTGSIALTFENLTAAASGQWMVSVQVTSTGDPATPVPPPVPLPVSDTGNSWAVATKVSHG